MIKAIGLAAVSAVLSLLPLNIADAHPANPERWLRHEARQMDCVIQHAERLSYGPPNRGLVCDARGQRFDIVYYRRIEKAVDWWRWWVISSDCWIARDGLVLVIPDGAVANGVDTGAYDRQWAKYAADRLHGDMRAV